MASNVPKSWPLVNGFVPIHWHYPTSGKSGDALGMADPRPILAENLRALMDYARDTGHPERASVKGLSRLSSVGRYSIDGMLEGSRNTGIETLQRIADVFEIQAWTLLVPHLDPSNPPTKPMSKTEVQLYKRMGKVAREYEQLQRAQREQESPGSTPSPDRIRKGSIGNGKSGRFDADD